MLSAKFPTYREKSGQGEINLLTEDLKFVALAVPDFGTAISGATNASPIVITSNTHGLTTGDEVFIVGVAGNTAANGYWKVTVLSSTTFSLDGSAGNGSYSSGGGDFLISLNEYEFLDDVPEDGRVAISTVLTGKTLDAGYFAAANPEFELAAGAEFQALALFMDSGDPATSPLVMLTSNSVSLPKEPDGQDIEIILGDFIFRQ